MCYSAQIRAEYKIYVRHFGATLTIDEYVKRFWEQVGDDWVKKMAKAFRAWFDEPADAEQARIRDAIADWERREVTRIEKDLFALKQRLAGAERTLATKTTKKALDDQRIATNKIEQGLAKLADLKRSELKPRDARIYPSTLAPVIVSEGGRRVVKFMRYQCRPAGKPAFYDREYPGTYNARRDNLEGFWKGQFGHSHGLMIVDTFYENVEGPDGKNQILQFTPRTAEPMLVACLWSHWTDPKGAEPDLLSFAAITDDPEPEVAAAGHDRTIINIKPEHVDAWLNPNPKDLKALYAIFDDKQHPYYEHRLAA